jgi:aminopeptidase YwaD
VTQVLADKARQYLQRLCEEIPSRRVGSAGNRDATSWFADTLESFGFHVECPTFDCIDWRDGGADLAVDGDTFDVRVSPYSLGGQARAQLVVVSTADELEAADVENEVVLLRGEIAKEQLMPKNFSFYNPDEHKHIIQLLEAKQPLAIVAATTRNPEVAGAVYPFPLFEDGDFDIPSVYMTEEEGSRLAPYAGHVVALDIRARRTPAEGCNVIGHRGANPQRRVVLFAHIDAKDGTPGATDNATGVVVLALLAELQADYAGDLGIEIVALNGEDYYSAAGEMDYLRRNEGRFQEIVLGINLDGAGYHEGSTAYSTYDCPSEIERCVQQTFSQHADIVEGERWYQSDHGLFLMNQRPALAITSQYFMELLATVAHTPKDHPRIVDPAKLVDIATALSELLLCLDQCLPQLGLGAAPASGASDT